MVHTSDCQNEQHSFKGAIMRSYLPPPRMPNMNCRAGHHHVKAPHPQEARTCQSATCWSPDEEGTWSRSVWCPTVAATVGRAWVSWSGRRGGREARFLLVSSCCVDRNDTQMGCSGLAPCPKSRLRGALAQSLCAFSAASPSTPPPIPA